MPPSHLYRGQEGAVRPAYRVVTSAIKGLTHLLCRVDGAHLVRVPERGPLIIVANHINFLEVPLIYTCLLYTSPSPRDLSTSRMPSSA